MVAFHSMLSNPWQLGFATNIAISSHLTAAPAFDGEKKQIQQLEVSETGNLRVSNTGFFQR